MDYRDKFEEKIYGFEHLIKERKYELLIILLIIALILIVAGF